MSARAAGSGGDSGASKSTGGGANRGPAHILSKIDPETLPEGDVWAEVARRARAYRRGQDGWQTGDIDHQLTEFGGDGE